MDSLKAFIKIIAVIEDATTHSWRNVGAMNATNRVSSLRRVFLNY